MKTKIPTKTDFFQQNDFCNLVHNGRDVWFSKHEFLLEDYREIEKIDAPVTVICGNSDYSFTYEMAEKAPSNVKQIFATNSICSDGVFVKTLPIGIESSFSAKRQGHGQSFSFAAEKEQLILKAQQAKNQTKNLIYSNFSVETNREIRGPLSEFLSGEHITRENNVPMSDFFYQISCHEAVLCPIGNGLDTVRTYETLYCGKIPIIYGSDVIYNQLFLDLPCVHVSSVDQINDEEFISKEIKKAQQKNKIDIAYMNYWIRQLYD